MSTLSEHTGNGNPPATRLQREDTKEHIDGVLQHFDVLPSRFDRFLFKYIYVYLIGLFFLDELLFIIFLGISSQLQVGRVLLGGGSNALIVVGSILVIWPFNVWRLRSPKTLRDLFEKKRLSLSDGDADTSYLRLLENYRDALASPKRYFLSGFPVVVYGLLSASIIVHYLIFVEHPNYLVTILWVVGTLIDGLLFFGVLYCFGIVLWVTYISGWYVRKLVRAFEFRIQPFHTDKCGGLKLLGNFCFGLGSPMLIASGFTIGYILLSLLGSRVDGILLALKVGLPLLLLLLYAFPAIVLAFMLPLRDIHTKMVSEGETDEDIYNARIEALREEIQSLLAINQVDDAKVLQEKKALVETLHTPYPTWPFRVRSKIFSTVLGVSGSLLIGVITAALQQYILSLLFHKP
jgi:hypothetical protein